MKILYIAHSLPYPLTDGIRMHVYHLLRELSKKHEIHLVCFAFSPHDKEYIDKVEPFCRSIDVVVHPVPKQPWKRIFSMVFDNEPFCLQQFRSPLLATAIREVIRKVKPDVVHFDHTPMAQYELDVPTDLPKIFLPHDALSMLFETSYKNETNLLRKFYFWNQFKKLKKYESGILPRFDKTVVVSPVDQAALKMECPTARIDWNPLGVDTEFFTERPGLEEDNVILFRGIMDFFPNHDAAMFFMESVLPLIQRKKPDIEFRIAGHNPMGPLRQLAIANPRVKLLGFVPDLRETMARAAVIVIPMRAGSGMKTKVLEALAMGKAVVATPYSLAGISVRNECELLMGSTPQELAAQTVLLLGDAARRRQLGRAGREYVKIHHSWAAHAEFFEREYDDIVNSERTHDR